MEGAVTEEMEQTEAAAVVSEDRDINQVIFGKGRPYMKMTMKTASSPCTDRSSGNSSEKDHSWKRSTGYSA